MRSGSLAPPMGGAGGSGIVEADETFIGRKKGVAKRRGAAHKHAVLTLVERGGEVRSVHVDDVKAETLMPIVNANIAKEARVMTDDAATYYNKLDDFAEHDVVNHSAEEYVSRGDVHTNTVEGYFSIFKRGMKGVYQHCNEKHLHRYLAEFDFRYNNRVASWRERRAARRPALKGGLASGSPIERLVGKSRMTTRKSLLICPRRPRQRPTRSNPNGSSRPLGSTAQTRLARRLKDCSSGLPP